MLNYCLSIFMTFLFIISSSSIAFAEEEKLLVAPYIAVPTTTGITINLVAADKDFEASVKYKTLQDITWQETKVNLKSGLAENLRLKNLNAGSQYEYQVSFADKILAEGTFSTMPEANSQAPFSFAVMTDAHINPTNPERNSIVRAVGNTANANLPTFSLHLGDNIQTVGTSHGGPAADPSHPSFFYLYFRNALGRLQSNGANFIANGNWEGENGWHPAINRSWAELARMSFAPGPDDKAYPEGGSAKQDYYAFTWSNALFVVLNATGYNIIDHAHTTGIGKADDWTLGQKQLAWLEQSLANSNAQFKFIFIHHAVGGKAGDEINSRYGRGGGLAAKVGEQAIVHEMMKKYGVQVFFYGHDHVFTDIEVDGIHYICNGSAGAPWKFATYETGYTEYIEESGFTLVNVDKDKATVRYITPDISSEKGKELFKLEIK